MSAPRLIYPMLDGFLLGDALSSHNGVRCYPAIRRNTDEKYIVKVISIPASQVQLDALLLTGALSGREAALEYFNKQAEDLVRQTETLRSLSHQEGFVPYLDAQIVPMEDGVGYEVYLLGSYKHSVEKILRSDTMTHLGVIHMGLDLCAALAACRRAGYLFVDLQPGNIFHTEEHGYRIGDIGFVPLSSLKFASLPEKYHSSYTAPEMADDFAVLNATLDIYALGMVLYQAYNGGILPFEGNAPAEIPVPPLYADYEMADIILKACAPDPKDRWQDPTEMAQAMIDYLQRNEVTDSPLIPPVLELSEEAEAEAEIEEFLPEADEATLLQEMADLENADADELAFMAGLSADETAPSEESAADLDDSVVSEEISQMLAQADELIAHELPEPPVAPEPIDVPMPEPIVLEDPEPEMEAEPEPAPEETPSQEAETVLDEESEEAPAQPEETEEAAPAAAEDVPPTEEVDEPREPFHFPWRIVAVAALVILLIAAAIGGGHYYNNVYLQNIDDLILENKDDTLTVKVVCDIEDTLLTVICSDSYGNTMTKPVAAGIAVFTDLAPQTRYTVRVEIAGSHKLTGQTSETFSTPAQTQILTFTAGVGPEDGSVVLNFTANGPEVRRWTVTYGAEGVEEKSIEFTGHSVTITDLVIGADYTFTLSSADAANIAGQTEVAYTATKILLAQNLTITACGAGVLTVQWENPQGYTVESWIVHCFAAGYDQIITTKDLSYTFTGLDHSVPCTVDVMAVGMNQSVNTTIDANPVNIHSFDFSLSAGNGLMVTWNFSGTAPEGGWVLRYSMDGGAPQTLEIGDDFALLPAIPGTQYTIQLEAAGGVPVFGGSASYTLARAEAFNGYGITAEDMQWQMCLRPESDDWVWSDVAEESYKTSFAIGEQLAFVIHTSQSIQASADAMQIQFVLRNSEGALVHAETVTHIWDEMWTDGYCSLDVPFQPQDAGEYTLTIYFNGSFATEEVFTIA